MIEVDSCVDNGYVNIDAGIIRAVDTRIVVAGRENAPNAGRNCLLGNVPDLIALYIIDKRVVGQAREGLRREFCCKSNERCLVQICRLNALCRGHFFKNFPRCFTSKLPSVFKYNDVPIGGYFTVPEQIIHF